MDSDRSDEDPSRSSERIPVRVVGWSLAVVSFLSLWVFYPILDNGFVDWDDHIYLGELARMGRFSWSSMRWMWTSLEPFYLQPIAWMTHLADYQIWGLNAAGHHATNWVLHGVYVALVGMLVWLLTGKVTDLRPRERLAMSVLVALVCGVHPLQVESVAWVAARNGLLCSVWMVAALCAYVRSVGDDGNLNRRWWWMTVGLSAIALLTKPFAVSLPIVMLAVDYFPLRRHEKRGWWRLLTEKWAVIVLSALASVGAIAARARQQLEGLSENPLTERLLVAARGVVFYLWKLVWPAWLSPFYPLSDNVSLRSEEFLVPVVFCVVVTIVAVWLRKRMPVLLAAWASYLALLLPVCGLVQVGGQAVADRYAYLAMVPVLLALGSGILWMWRHALKWADTEVCPYGGFGWRIAKGTFCIALGAWLVFLGLRTREQIGVWHDDISLWGAALKHFPDDPRANYNLGVALLGMHRLEEARVAVERAVAHSDPHAPQLSLAHGALGVIDLKMHDYDAAIAQLQQAIAGDGTLWAAQYNLACAYAREGRLTEAYVVLQALVAKQPQYAALAARDGELAALRSDPELGPMFRDLVGSPKD
jgi:tetratricopeptide (TPR) repeat protein